ncbi:MAG: DUF692 domain-containing protein [Alphaproteobacteria bacterium]|nr:DUF692 domain-containing protein [Alphaproteobacteria bacterium]
MASRNRRPFVLPQAPLSPTAGLGLKPEHYREALEDRTDGLWFEVHPENYMADGGPRLAWLEAIRSDHDMSMHGVGLSLGGAEPPNERHLARLKALVDRYQPALVSEHLAWSVHSGVYFNDLLPTPMTQEALDHFCRHVDRVQEVLGRKILIENPSRYIPMREEISEADFLSETVRRTGCGLLVDVNNVHVSAHNLAYDPIAYLEALPAEAIGEIHLAGHEADEALGEALLIDTHGAAVTVAVWTLYAKLIERIGARPTLIERDTNIPAYNVIREERDEAARLLASVQSRAVQHV